MVIAGFSDELAILAVEGKVKGSFADLISEWNNSPGKQHRLEHLCRTLELDPANVGHLRYHSCFIARLQLCTRSTPLSVPSRSHACSFI